MKCDVDTTLKGTVAQRFNTLSSFFFFSILKSFKTCLIFFVEHRNSKSVA